MARKRESVSFYFTEITLGTTLVEGIILWTEHFWLVKFNGVLQRKFFATCIWGTIIEQRTAVHFFSRASFLCPILTISIEKNHGALSHYLPEACWALLFFPFTNSWPLPFSVPAGFGAWSSTGDNGSTAVVQCESGWALHLFNFTCYCGNLVLKCTMEIRQR